MRVMRCVGRYLVLGCAAVFLGGFAPSATWAAEVPVADTGVEPRVEPISRRAPNQPYQVRGRRYEPLTDDVPFKQRGLSSWYGMPFHGRRTASGETFDMHALTAAHPTLPIPSYAKVRHVKTGKEVIVRINDRGPFHGERILDLSKAAAQQLGLLGQGTAEVEVERITFEDIRTGKWRQTDEVPVLAVAVPEPQVDDPLQAVMAMADTSEADTSVPAAQDASPSPATPYWVQLGAFEQEDGAERFRKRVRAELQELGGMLATFRSGALTHLQLGPFAGPVEAGQVAQRVRTLLHLVPVVVQRP